MGLSTTEIEVLLKMRAAGQEALDLFSGTLNKTGAAGTAAAKGLGDAEKGARGAGAGATAAGVAFGLLVDRVLNSLVGGFKSSITEANRLDSALVGLSSVARAFGHDAGAAQQAARDLATDGLMNVGEAAAGLKNLLAAGFGLDQAIVLMHRFKDSAAFGRQGALEFGQAIVGATEGIKNSNSMMVDNAGVTKNLSVILQEAGFSANDLQRASSDVNVRMGIFKGLLKETNPQLGDTERLLKTSAGAQAQFNAQLTIFQQKAGKELQGTLGSVLGLLTPIVKTSTEWANVIVPLATGIGAVVAPMAAWNAANALGITKLFSLEGGVSGLLDKMGPLGKASVVAGVAIGAWELGRAIAQVFDLDTKIANLTARLLGWGDVAAQTAGAKQDVINRAIALGAERTITYAAAVEFLTQKHREALAPVAAVQAAEKKLTDEREKHASLGLAIAAAEQKVRDELKNSGFSVGELTKVMRQNEDAFKAWAEKHNLSAETLKFLEGQIKKTDEATKKAKEETKKHTEELDKQRSALEQLGILTLPAVQKRLGELNALVETATREGIDITTVIRALWPEYVQLAAAAKSSGVGIDFVNAAMDRQAERGKIILATTRQLGELYATLPTDKVHSGNQQLLDDAHRQIQADRDLADAYSTLGVKSRAELQKIAEYAVSAYQLIGASGTATPQQIAEAFKRMKDAVNAANGEVPSFWQTHVVPGITRQIGLLQDAVTGSFAQMLLGAKGFGEGFVDVWKSVKASVLNIFTEILDAFVRRVLGGILSALAGGKSGLSSGFGGFMSSLLGGGGSSSGGILSGLFGGVGAGGLTLGQIEAGSAAPLSAGLFGGGAAGGGAGAGAAGAGAGIGMSTILGGAGIGAAGLGLGELFQKIFDSKKAGAIGGGLSGAGAGALLGTAVFPGIGTALGAVIGGLSGILGGVLGGPSKKEKQGREVVAEVEAQLAGLLTAQQRIEAGGEKWKMTVIAVRDAYLATGRSEQDAEAAVKALWDSSRGGAAAVQAAIMPILEALDKQRDKMLQNAAAAADSADDIGDSFGKIKIPELKIPYRYYEEGGIRGPGDISIEEVGGAASGIFTNRPTLRVFGEGGEPELGGPVSFMEKALKGALQQMNAGVGGDTTINLTFHVSAFDVAGFQQVTERDIVPMLADTVSSNRRGARTKMRAALGVTS